MKSKYYGEKTTENPMFLIKQNGISIQKNIKTSKSLEVF